MKWRRTLISLGLVSSSFLHSLSALFIEGEITIRSMEFVIDGNSQSEYFETTSYTAIVITTAFQTPLYLNGTYPLPLNSITHSNLYGSTRLWCDHGHVIYESHPVDSDQNIEAGGIPRHIIPLNVHDSQLSDAVKTLKYGLGYVMDELDLLPLLYYIYIN